MTQPSSFPLPSVHLNGTGRKTLSEGYFNAYSKLQEADRAFREIEFNARDYYVQGPGAWPQARTERDAMHAKFEELRVYLETHLAHLGE